MNTELKSCFYDKLRGDKINISWNKNLIRMDLFLSFLTVQVERSYDHLGSCTGWTQLYNKERQLLIKGGLVGGVEYLDSLQYGIKLSNPYNNYVSPFYMFDILTKKGHAFFLDYYAEDIDNILSTEKDGIAIRERNLLSAKEIVQDIEKEIELLKSNCKPNEHEQ